MRERNRDGRPSSSDTNSSLAFRVHERSRPLLRHGKWLTLVHEAGLVLVETVPIGATLPVIVPGTTIRSIAALRIRVV